MCIRDSMCIVIAVRSHDRVLACWSRPPPTTALNCIHFPVAVRSLSASHCTPSCHSAWVFLHVFAIWVMQVGGLRGPSGPAKQSDLYLLVFGHFHNKEYGSSLLPFPQTSSSFTCIHWFILFDTFLSNTPSAFSALLLRIGVSEAHT